MSPQCSVVIPVYNREEYIERTLRSILNQTFKDIEVIVIDDASTDQSWNKIQEVARQDPRIRTYRNKTNAGVAETRNRGICLAEGKYVALLDSDDVWVKDKLQRQMAQIKETGCRISYCGYGFFDKDGNRIGDTFHVPASVDLQRLLKRNVISCSTVVGETTLFRSHPFDKSYYHEDLVAWISMLQECKRACGVPEELAEITIMKGSRSGNKWTCARHRWKIYRDFLKMGRIRGLYYFMNYAYYSVVKYRPIRKEL
ncbi:glycosyltransferase family 2 protein [Alkalibacter rhizosphaerae]|uniref:Glycosyltransferase family 2 protein n=1 Tax=Alkalibacter rhizosphaerae TaxID=2815577 RepID=A0A974XIX1_9FIRM|nr:glycosyltransferase family 2 protein [Alkalibacter rhizosphaerae]QSX09600.1 glycosyltransferase family 2 protein [Alkalibacter rhizosphaerae]